MRDAHTQVVHRVAEILKLWIPHRGPLSVRQVADRVKLARSTVHRLLSDLENEGFLSRASQGGYIPGIILIQLAEAARSCLEIVEVAKPHMFSLRDITRETVALHVLDGLARRCIYQVESPEQLRRVYTDIGSPIPLHAGAAGLVMLAYLPDQTVQEFLSGRLEAFTPQTITDPAMLKEELARVRREGVAVSRSQRTVGIASCAAPLFDANHKVIGSLNITGPELRFTLEREKRYAELVRKAAAEISCSLGKVPVRGR